MNCIQSSYSNLNLYYKIILQARLIMLFLLTHWSSNNICSANRHSIRKNHSDHVINLRNHSFNLYFFLNFLLFSFIASFATFWHRILMHFNQELVIFSNEFAYIFQNLTLKKWQFLQWIYSEKNWYIIK